MAFAAKRVVGSSLWVVPRKSQQTHRLGYRLGVGAVWRSDKLSYQGVAIGGGRSCWAVLRREDWFWGNWKFVSPRSTQGINARGKERSKGL